MDRDGYAQLNRMEGVLNHLVEGQKFIINYDSTNALIGFYEEEIVNEKGQFHYLNKDEKLKAFFEGLIQEIPEEESETEEQEKEKGFENKPFAE